MNGVVTIVVDQIATIAVGWRQLRFIYCSNCEHCANYDHIKVKNIQTGQFTFLSGSHFLWDWIVQKEFAIYHRESIGNLTKVPWSWTNIMITTVSYLIVNSDWYGRQRLTVYLICRLTKCKEYMFFFCQHSVEHCSLVVTWSIMTFPVGCPRKQPMTLQNIVKII